MSNTVTATPKKVNRKKKANKPFSGPTLFEQIEEDRRLTARQSHHEKSEQRKLEFRMRQAEIAASYESFEKLKVTRPVAYKFVMLALEIFPHTELKVGERRVPNTIGAARSRLTSAERAEIEQLMLAERCIRDALWAAYEDAKADN